MSLIPLLFLLNSASAELMREESRDVITGVPPYHAGQGTDHYAFLGVFRVIIQFFLYVLGPWPPNVSDSVTFPLNSASAVLMREESRDVITGVPP